MTDATVICLYTDIERLKNFPSVFCSYLPGICVLAIKGSYEHLSQWTAKFPKGDCFTESSCPMYDRVVRTEAPDVKCPTGLGVSRASVLDILLCNRFPSITSASVVPGISDHEAEVATMKCLNVPRYRNPPKKAYMFNRGDYGSLGFDLMNFLSDFEV